MTLEEYRFYSDIAIKLFNFMNGNINKMNSNCELHIEMYDYIHGVYANIRYPNHVVIFIGTIIDSWSDEYYSYLNKETYVSSCIAWALSHELHHADQFISMIRYNSNQEYKDNIEADVNRASYDWVKEHGRELSCLVGVEISMTKIYSPSLTNNTSYRKASVAEFYKQTIANIILRDLDLFFKLKVFTDDSVADDIIISFNNLDKIVIKSKGRYLEENINAFSDMSYRYAGYYDMYSIQVEVKVLNESDRNIALVNFNTHNELIRPMIFKTD